MAKSPATSPAPLCFLCARYRDSYRCEAFPEGIPFDIISSQVDHRLPAESDLGLHVVPVTEVAEKYAEDLFSPPPLDSRRSNRRSMRPAARV